MHILRHPNGRGLAQGLSTAALPTEVRFHVVKIYCWSIQKKSKDLQEEFNKQMVFAYGEEELMQRQREQMHGNMRFLVELFKLKLVRGVLIRDCLEDLF